MATFVELHACFDKCESAPIVAAADNPFSEIYLSVPVLIKSEQIVGIAPLFNGACVNLKDKQECLRVVETPDAILSKLDRHFASDLGIPLLAMVLGAISALVLQRLVQAKTRMPSSASVYLRKEDTGRAGVRPASSGASACRIG